MFIVALFIFLYIRYCTLNFIICGLAVKCFRKIKILRINWMSSFMGVGEVIIPNQFSQLNSICLLQNIRYIDSALRYWFISVTQNSKKNYTDVCENYKTCKYQWIYQIQGLLISEVCNSCWIYEITNLKYVWMQNAIVSMLKNFQKLYVWYYWVIESLIKSMSKEK